MSKVYLVISPDDREEFRRRFTHLIAFANAEVVDGGAERFDSVANALARVLQSVDLVAVHDAVRPLGTTQLQGMLFLNGVSRYVVPSSSLEALDRLQHRIVVIGEHEVLDRHQRFHDSDQIVRAEFANKRRHRVTDGARALAAHLVVGEQDPEHPHIVSRGLALFRVAVQHLSRP